MGLPPQISNRKPQIVKKIQKESQEAHNLFVQGFASHQNGQLEQAKTMYEQVLVKQPKHFDALHLLGVMALQNKNPKLAAEFISKATAIKSDYADAFYNLGIAFQELLRWDEALVSFDKSVTIKPDYAEAFNNRGNVLRALNRAEDALISFDKAISLKPDYADSFNNRGNALRALNRAEDALLSFDQAIAIKPDHVEALNNRAITLLSLKRLDEALSSFDIALTLDPYDAETLNNRGNALQALKRVDEALGSYVNALAIKPDYEFLFGLKIHTQMKLCDWDEIEVNLNQLKSRLFKGQKVATPFHVLGLIDDPAIQLSASKIYADSKYPISRFHSEFRKRKADVKIRIGYYSADFHNHATSYLMAELFEAHDRQKFELYGFSFGPDIIDGMRQRVSAGFDNFFNVTEKSDQEVATISRDLRIDIAIDLKGFTEDSRTRIFAERCAPIQINYLGYPGTMGAPYFDYIIADKTLIPQKSQKNYAEKVVYLPHSYQVNDSKRKISDKVFSRQEAGLPERGFVICCFNNNYKIMPTTFDGWMRILKGVTGSALWLFEDNPKAATNLRQEARSRGVDPTRLVFAKRMNLEDHLARHRLADLFLDTLPCNAHTTASDALWAGLPVLTCVGESFASRVAASLLSAVGLPELITQSQAQYEALAIDLGCHPEKLQALKTKLAINRLTTPLFDSALFTKHIESAYTQMYERYQNDLPPDTLYIE